MNNLVFYTWSSINEILCCSVPKKVFLGTVCIWLVFESSGSVIRRETVIASLEVVASFSLFCWALHCSTTC